MLTLTPISLDEIMANPPKTKYPIHFITNRVLKRFPDIQQQILPRMTTGQYPLEAFTVNFQTMSKPTAHALVYIRGEGNKTVNQYSNKAHQYSQTTGRAIVSWEPYNSIGTFTDLGQVTVSTPQELVDFTKVINWVWLFMAQYKKELQNAKK